MDLPPGFLLGPYEILAPLGKGGMGEVYRARDMRLDRPVAVKVLPADRLARNPASLARFEREARAVASINHPNIMGIFDFATDNDTVYVAMELLEGESLKARLADGPLSVRRTLVLVRQMAQGLAAAHRQGIIHRDLKPDNLFITREGRLKILDFGLAKRLPGLEEATGGALTLDGKMMGTLGYMSPEQVRGEEVGPASDIFALGAVLFEMLTGVRAFKGDTPWETLNAILKEEPTQPDGLVQPIPSSLRRILRRCLEKNPQRRFQDAQELVEALENVSEESDLPLSVMRLRWRSAFRHRWGWALLAAALAGAFLALWVAPRAAGPEPAFHRVTYATGTLAAARFGPDGKTLYYSWQTRGGPPEILVLDPRGTEPERLGFRDALLLGVSASSELAFLESPRLDERGICTGTLAVAGGQGAVPRDSASQVSEAAWDGDGLAFIRTPPLQPSTLEFPIGQRREVAGGGRHFLRMARDGRRLALLEAVPGQKPGILLVDREGGSVSLPLDGMGEVTGLAWGPERDLWISERLGDQTTLWALDLNGGRHRLWRGPEGMELLDVAAGGTALMAQHQDVQAVWSLSLPGQEVREISEDERFQAAGLSPDGRFAILIRAPEGEPRIFRRDLESGKLWDLGPGRPLGLSPDGTHLHVDLGAVSGRSLDPDWIRALREAGLPESSLDKPEERARFLLFAGCAGGRAEAFRLPTAFKPLGSAAALLLPGGRRALALLASGSKAFWAVLDRDALEPRLVTLVGQAADVPGSMPLSPDGSRLVVTGDFHTWYVQPLDGKPPVPVRGVRDGERILGWSADGKALHLRSPLSTLPVTLTRLDLRTGIRSTLAQFTPPILEGHVAATTVHLTPAGQTFLITCRRRLSRLYRVEALR